MLNVGWKTSRTLENMQNQGPKSLEIQEFNYRQQRAHGAVSLDCASQHKQRTDLNHLQGLTFLN